MIRKKKQFIKSLVRSANLDLLVLQEHWLSESQLNSIANIDSHMVSCGVSGFDNSDVLAAVHTAAVPFCGVRT